MSNSFYIMVSHFSTPVYADSDGELCRHLL